MTGGSLPGWQEYVVDPLARLLELMAGALGGYGVAIILFTVAIRLAIVPLTAKQMRSQRVMQELQPKIAAIKKIAKGDRQKESALTMELYKREKVNPLAGCFPMLIQMPVLLGLYGALLTLTRCLGDNGLPLVPQVADYQACLQAGGRMLINEPFLWFNLADVDRTFQIPIVTGVPFLSYVSVLAIMAGAVQWVQTMMMTPVTTAAEGTQATMQRMMQFMPLMIVFFAWGFFSGIVLYWVISGFIGVVQQFFTTGLGKFEPLLPEPARAAAVRIGAGRFSLPRLTKEELESATADAEATLNVDGQANPTRRPKARTRKRRRRSG